MSGKKRDSEEGWGRQLAARQGAHPHSPQPKAHHTGQEAPQASPGCQGSLGTALEPLAQRHLSLGCLTSQSCWWLIRQAEGASILASLESPLASPVWDFPAQGPVDEGEYPWVTTGYKAFLKKKKNKARYRQHCLQVKSGIETIAQILQAQRSLPPSVSDLGPKGPDNCLIGIVSLGLHPRLSEYFWSPALTTEAIVIF